MSEAEGLKANELSKRLIPRGDAIKLSGVYDLPMLGAERERIEIEYLNRVNDGHDPIETTTLKSAYVQNTEGTIYELQFLLLREGVAPTIDDFRPTGSLEDIQFVVRNDVLRNIKDEAEFDKAWDEAGKLNYVNQELTRQYSHLSSLEREPSDPAYNERKHLAEKEIKKLTAKKEKLDRVFRGEDSIEPEQTEAQQRQIELIEKVRELMQKEIDSNAWPSEKQGKEGLLKFIWRKHGPAIKSIYGTVQYETIRRKTSPAECEGLGLPPLPK